MSLVLAKAVLGLTACGAPYTELVREAALFGVYLHGLAADLALQTQSQESLLATDVITYIGAAFKNL